MKKKKFVQIILFCLGCFILFLADQFTKYLAIHSLKDTSGIALIPDVFELQYVENRGAAFGILQQKRIFLILISVIVLCLLYYFYHKIPEGKRYFPLRLISVMLVSGAIGNMIDRIVRGYVVDFLYFKWINFPVFNVADCYVVISVIADFLFLCFYYSDDELRFLDIRKKKGNE